MVKPYNFGLNPFSMTPHRIPTFPEVARTTALRFGNTGVLSTGTNAATRIVLLRSPVLPVMVDSAQPFVLVGEASYPAGNGGPIICPSINLIGSPNGSAPLNITFSGTANTNTFLIRDETTGASSYVPIVNYGISSVSVWLFNGDSTGTNWTGDETTAMLRVEWLMSTGETAESTHPVTAGGSTSTSSITFLFPVPNALVIGVRPLNVSSIWNAGYSAGRIRVVTHNFETAVATPAVGAASGSLALALPRTVLQPLFAPPGINQSLVPYQDSRLTALGVHVRNVTKIMNKEGTWLAARVSSRTTNPFAVDLNALYPTLNVLDRATGPLEADLTLVLPPSSKLMDFEDHIMSSGSFNTATTWITGNTPILQYANLTQFVVATAFDPDTATPTTLAIDGAWHLEFRHSGTLWPLQVTRESLETHHHRAIVAVERPPAIFGPAGRVLTASRPERAPRSNNAPHTSMSNNKAPSKGAEKKKKQDKKPEEKRKQGKKTNQKTPK